MNSCIETVYFKLEAAGICNSSPDDMKVQELGTGGYNEMDIMTEPLPVMLAI